MTHKLPVSLAVLALLLAACAPPASGGPTDNPYAPQPDDDKLTRGPVFLELEQSELLVMESAPIQVTALLRGNLPDPCHQVRAIVTVDEGQKRVDIELYSLADPAVACITVIEPFEANLPLGSFSGGRYSVYVTTDPALPAELLGEFDS